MVNMVGETFFNIQTKLLTGIRGCIFVANSIGLLGAKPMPIVCNSLNLIQNYNKPGPAHVSAISKAQK